MVEMQDYQMMKDYYNNMHHYHHYHHYHRQFDKQNNIQNHWIIIKHIKHKFLEGANVELKSLESKLEVDDFDGSKVGLLLGCDVGCDEGCDVGCDEGCDVGCDVGCDEGMLDIGLLYPLLLFLTIYQYNICYPTNQK